MSNKCKCKEVECEECPEWIFTLADLIMCMMGLFVILWVLKPTPPGGTQPKINDQITKVMAAIRESLGSIPNVQNPDIVDLQMMLDKVNRTKLDGPGHGGKTEVTPNGPLGTDPDVTAVRPGQQAIVGGRLMFDPGVSTLSHTVKQELDQIVTQIKGHRNIVLVKGHTSLDDLPDSATAQQRMDLSLRRAQAVADYLTAAGVEPDVIRVVGCSTFEPVRERVYSENARAINRRVEVESTPTLVTDLQDPPKTEPVPVDSLIHSHSPAE
ncbi:MAG TPA: OmpA family protein [Tepidisphaeraceae bacterium]|nr:OmpA family protein [Tepidisphaeraceae bacterium]